MRPKPFIPTRTGIHGLLTKKNEMMRASHPARRLPADCATLYVK